MRKRDARKLHSGDEVQVKATKDYCMVLSVEEKDGNILLETDYNGFTTFTHRDVR